MKVFFTLFLFIGIASIAISTPENLHRYDGFWYNHYKQKTIEVRSFPDGMEVRGLHPSNRWIWFERRSKNSFYDRFGNRFKISGRSIKYLSASRRGRLTFERIVQPYHGHRDSGRTRYKSDREGSDFYDKDDYYDFDDTMHLGREDHSIQYGGSKSLDLDIQQKTLSMLQDPEGVWSIEGLDKRVYITETRDGFKARFSDQTKWYSYIWKTNESLYAGDNGHTYYIQGDKLVWIDRDNTRKFVLTKIADDFGD